MSLIFLKFILSLNLKKLDMLSWECPTLWVYLIWHSNDYSNPDIYCKLEVSTKDLMRFRILEGKLHKWYWILCTFHVRKHIFSGCPTLVIHHWMVMDSRMITYKLELHTEMLRWHWGNQSSLFITNGTAMKTSVYSRLSKLHLTHLAFTGDVMQYKWNSRNITLTVLWRWSQDRNRE